MIKLEWSHTVLGAAMLAVPPFIILVWLTNKIGMGKALAAFGLATVVIVWVLTGIIFLAKGLKGI